VEIGLRYNFLDIKENLVILECFMMKITNFCCNTRILQLLYWKI